MQELFIKLIQSKIPENHSIADMISDALDINYDAAYRRITGKTKITLEEAVLLSKKFDISLNKLYEVGNDNSIIAGLSPRPKDVEGLELWFKASLNNIEPITKIKNAELIWSGKDITLFRILTDSLLTRYKMYVWLKDFDVEMAKSKITFDKWVTQIPNSLLESAFSLSEVYNHINITELWSANTVNGTLQQVLYYFEAGLVSVEAALKICEDIHQIIFRIEQQTIDQSLNKTGNNKFFKLYNCDLHTLTNSVFVYTPKQKVFFTPFTVLSYIKIENQLTCDVMYEFLKKQMSNSKLLATSGEKDRSLFFKILHDKINFIEQKIRLENKTHYFSL